jgi:hypothetical protein
MALSSANKASIRLYLGYSSRFFQVDGILEQAMLAIDSDSDAVTLLQALITRAQDVDTRLAAMDSRLKLVVAEDVTFAGVTEMMGLQMQGRRAVGRMASMLGVPVRHDSFAASTSNSAPTWMSGMFGSNDGGNMKLG